MRKDRDSSMEILNWLISQNISLRLMKEAAF